jgi:rfaE bifunctional protein kinase chain/domain
MSLERARDILSEFGRKKILVIGDIVLDHYVFGEVERLNPEAPVPVLRATHEEEQTGGAGNVAKNTAQLGAPTRLLAVVGDDRDADVLKRAADDEGYEAVLIRDPSRPTIRKTRHIAKYRMEGQQLLRVDNERTHDIEGVVEEQLIEALRDEIRSGVDGIIVSDYSKGTITRRVAEELLDLAGQHDVLVAADVKPSRAAYFVGATLVSPNVNEAHEYLGINMLERKVEPRELARLVYMKMCADVYLTLGADGLYVYNGGNTGVHLAQPERAIDPSGAGDTAIAVMLASLLAGATAQEAGELANAACGIVVKKVGAVGLTSDELRGAVSSLGNHE